MITKAASPATATNPKSWPMRWLKLYKLVVGYPHHRLTAFNRSAMMTPIMEGKTQINLVHLTWTRKCHRMYPYSEVYLSSMQRVSS